MNIGDKIELSEDHHKLVKERHDRIAAARVAFAEASALLLSAERGLWEAVREMRPDLDDWEMSLHMECKFLHLAGKRRRDA